MTEQAPHVPSPQAFFAPVRSASPRSQERSVRSPSASTMSPFNVNRTIPGNPVAQDTLGSVSCHVPPASSSADLQQSRRPATDWSGLALKVLLPMAGVVVALAIGAIMLVVLKADPIAAYAALVRGAVGTRFGLTQTLVKATPLLLVGLGICIAFRANVINIGGEGQIIAGALMAAWFPLTFPSWPGWLLIPVDHDRRLPGRVCVGIRSRNPQSTAEGERDPQHDHDELDRPAAHEPSPAGPAHGSRGRQGKDIPGAIGAIARRKSGFRGWCRARSFTRGR